MPNEVKNIKKIVICCCADYKHIQADAVRLLSAAAESAGVTVELCADLCLEAVQNPNFLQALSSPGTVVAACFPRAVKALFYRAHVSPPQLLDLRHQPLAQLLASLGWQAVAKNARTLPPYDHEWKAWYPAIDAERCNRCGKCVDYCFFGVYARQGKDIQVRYPQKCKNNCPACARMCPQKAIIFPKHTESPINGGQADPLQPTAPVDKSQMFDEQLYHRLAQRRRGQRKSDLLKE
jgi:heterodisulfide reductase subunit A-like polyferredoxin